MDGAFESILHRPLGTEAYALVVSVPLTAQEFLDDYVASQTSERGDFAAQAVRKNREVDKNLSLSTLASQFEADASLMVKVCEFARDFNIQVVTRATEADLRQCLAERQIVFFISHLRLPDISADDCLDPVKIVQILRHPETPLQIELSREVHWRLQQPEASLAEDAVVLLDALDDEFSGQYLYTKDALVESLGKILNHIHSIAYDLLQKPTDGQNRHDSNSESNLIDAEMRKSRDRRLVRIAIEGALGDAFRIGKCIEFFDGMKDIRSLIDCIPASEDKHEHAEGERIVDMSLCNSVCLAEGKNIPRSCRLRVGRSETNLIFAGAYCLKFFEEVARLSDHGGISFADAHNRTLSRLAENIFSKQIKKTTTRRRHHC